MLWRPAFYPLSEREGAEVVKHLLTLQTSRPGRVPRSTPPLLETVHSAPTPSAARCW